MKKAVLLLFVLAPLFGFAQQQADIQKRQIILSPVAALTDSAEFDYIKGTLYNVLLINLQEQKTLDILNDRPDAEPIISKKTAFEPYLQKLQNRFPGATAIIAEYYVADEKLNVMVNVWELDTLRIKNSFIESMPADLDMLSNIELLSARIAQAVAQELGPTEREEVFNRQIAASLRKKINQEEQLVEEVYALHHEISAVLFTGIGIGRSVVSWSEKGPAVSPLVAVEYSLFFDAPYHLRFGVEYMGFNIQDFNSHQQEISAEVLFGTHTLSSFSFFADAGISITWDYNAKSAPHARTGGTEDIYPEVQRFSVGVPVHLDISMYLSPNFFIDLRLKYHGLTWTIETEGPDSYDLGALRMKYFYGFSPWNFLCLSINAQLGVRF
ncbi:MAG: hypothetical protein JW904_02935 [Spirochaetales bacterium]|nr:hypothetical protein [Spirochaetales bacterium]